MGQHKHNPTAIAAKNGEIKPKEKSLSKSEHKEALSYAIEKIIAIPFENVQPYLK